MFEILKLLSLSALLIILIFLNQDRPTIPYTEEATISKIHSCSALQLLNTYPVHFPDLPYYQHEPYSDLYMTPVISYKQHDLEIQLRQPYLKASFQFTALLKQDLPINCNIFNQNYTGKSSVWNSHHHERIFTAVVTCEFNVLLPNTTMRVKDKVVKYIFNDHYDVLDNSISFNQLFSLKTMQIDTCVVDIPQLPLNMYKFMINQIFPFSVHEHTIKTPFLHKSSICLSPLRGNLPYLAEWLEYYISLNINHFYIYDYDLSKEALSLLYFYKARGLVTIIDWKSLIPMDFSVRNGWYFFQSAANNDCVFQFRQVSKYLMFVDPDEFLKLSLGNGNMDDLINDFEKNSRYDILVEIEFLNWFYATQIDALYEKRLINIIDTEVAAYLQQITEHFNKSTTIADIGNEESVQWHKFESIVTLMSYKSKGPVNNRKKFIGKSMLMEETRIHKAFPYHYTRKYELPVDFGYVMHFRDLNSGQFGSRYAEVKDLIREKIDKGVGTFDLADTKTLDTTYLFSKRQDLTTRLKAVEIAYTKWLEQ